MHTHTINGVRYMNDGKNFALVGRPAAITQNFKRYKEIQQELPWEMGRGTEANHRLAGIIQNQLGDWTNGECEAADRVNDFNDVEAKAVRGWPNGVERLAEVTKQVQRDVPLPKSVMPQIHWSDQGDEFDIHRMYSGNLDASWSSERGGLERGPRIVKLLVPYGGNCDKTMEQLFWTGAAAVVLGDVLGNAGFSVQIDGYHISQQRTHYSAEVLTLKHAGESLNPSAIAWSLCHPASFRTATGFFNNVFSPHKWNTGGYGHSANLTDPGARAMMEGFGLVGDEDTVRIDSSPTTKAQCVAAVTKALADIEKLIVREGAEAEA
jgi:hypothetical protein